MISLTNSQDISPQEKFCPRVQSLSTLPPNIGTFIDKTFIMQDYKDVQNFYITYKGNYVKLNITKYDTLEVDTIIAHNLFADKFTLRQTTFQNGDLMVSDGGVVEAVSGTTITFKDTTGFNVCAFAVGDLIEAHTVNANTKLAITNPQGTVTAVYGKQVTVTYNSISVFRVGDEVYRVGNLSDTTRQDSFYFSTNRANTPYFAIYDNISSWDTVGHASTAWTTATPKILIGNGKSLNASYTHGVYIQAGGQLIIDPAASVTGLVTALPIYTSGTTFPSTPKTGDWHFYTKTPPDAPYKTNSWYQWSGSAWTNYGLLGTYIDSTGLYTGTVVANNILAGTGFINALSVFTTFTIGSASTDGYIQSYGWNGTVNGFQLKGGATPSFNIIGGTFTSGIIRTSATVGDGSSSSAGILINSTGIAGYPANSSIPKFSVSATSGIMTATDVVLTGEVNATSGKFGTVVNYLAVSAKGLTITSATDDVYLNFGKTDFTNTQTGFILGYDYSASLAKFYMGNSTKYFNYDGTDLTMVGGNILSSTMTANTIQTKVDPGSGDRSRIIFSSTNNRIEFYDYSNHLNYIYSDGDAISVSGNMSAPSFVSTGQCSFASTNFYINADGALTKVDNKAASSYNGYALISDGYSYTAQQVTRWRGESSSAPSSPIGGDRYYNYSTLHFYTYIAGSASWVQDNV